MSKKIKVVDSDFIPCTCCKNGKKLNWFSQKWIECTVCNGSGFVHKDDWKKFR